MRNTRLSIEEIRIQGTIVVLNNVLEEHKSVVAVGWVEDAPHAAADDAIVLHEPIYMAAPVPFGSTSSEMSVIGGTRGLPLSVEFFDFGRVEIYEGNSPFGKFYLQCLSNYREAFANDRSIFRVKVAAQPQASDRRMS